MKRIASMLGVLVLAGCSVVDSSEPELEDVGVDVPPQEVYDAQADAAITEANADAEFEKLRREIESDG